jgi:hypothetical protein
MSSVSFFIIDYFKILFFGVEGIVFITEPRNVIFNTFQNVNGSFRSIILLIFIFYLIFYAIYWFITNIIPETGLLTFFIPIRELLLMIPPLPELTEYGVFRFIEALFKAFGLSTALEKIKAIMKAKYRFSRENMKRIVDYFFPDTDLSKNLPDVRETEEEKKLRKEKEKSGGVLKDKFKNAEEEARIMTKNVFHINTDFDKAKDGSIEIANKFGEIKGQKSYIEEIIKINN